MAIVDFIGLLRCLEQVEPRYVFAATRGRPAEIRSIMSPEGGAEDRSTIAFADLEPGCAMEEDCVPEAPAGSAEQVQLRHEENRVAWNDGAAAYTRDNAARLARLRAGQSNLHPLERRHLARFGPLADWCRRAIHLQCASGEDTLSLWLEGAHELVGVDISDVHIENAQWVAQQLGAPARFIRADVLDTPAELDETADLVYTGRGALCWIQDLSAWAKVVSRLLRPGGIFHVLDDHPITWFFELASSELTLRPFDYFQHAERSRGWPDTYLGEPGRDPMTHPEKHERVHCLGHVFTALSDAGLNVCHFAEHREGYWNVFPNLPPEVLHRLPLTFSMLARKS